MAESRETKCNASRQMVSNYDGEIRFALFASFHSTILTKFKRPTNWSFSPHRLKSLRINLTLRQYERGANHGLELANWHPICLRAGRELQARRFHEIPWRRSNRQSRDGEGRCSDWRRQEVNYLNSIKTVQVI